MKILSINRSFYLLAIFFCALLAVITFSEALVRFQLGAQMFTLQSYPQWFLVVSFVSLVVSLLLLKYFHHKKFGVAFYAGLIDVLSTTWFLFILYNVLTGGGLRDYYMPSLIATFITSIPLAISLIFSAAGRRPWLKTAGVFLLLLKLTAVSMVFWIMTSQDIHRFETSEKISQWIVIAGSLLLLPLIMNFLGELKSLKKEKTDATQQPVVETATLIVGLLVIIPVIYIGGKISTERYWLANWVNRGPENAIKLAEPFDARTYVNRKGDTLLYRLLAPLNYDSTKKYPLALCLHGGGGRGTDNITQVEGSWTAQLLSEYQNRVKYPAFVFVPQCPPASSWGGIEDWPVVDSIVFEAMEALEKEFTVDETRRYVMGESLGGYGSWHFIAMHPKLFAAAVPICGGGDPTLANTFADIPLWAFHGAKDRSVPVKLSREMIAAMKNAGGDPKYTEYPDEGHIISKQVTTTPGLLDWVFEQKRDMAILNE